MEPVKAAVSAEKELPGEMFLQKKRRWVFGIPNKFLALFLKKKWHFIAGFFALLLLLSFGVVLKNVIIIAILTAIASVSTYYKYYIKFTIGFELVTFATVLTTVSYGPLVGAMVGFAAAIAAEVIPKLIDPSSFFWILSVPASAFIVALFHSMGVPIFWLGLISIAVQFIISEPLRLLSGDEYLKTMSLVNIITTTVWTIMWFRVLAPIVLPMMA